MARKATAEITKRNPIDLSEANISGTDLSGANLINANFSGAILVRMNFEGAILLNADLSRARLADANLRASDLRGANLSHSDLSGSRMTGAKLADADLQYAELRNTDLRGIDLSKANNLTWRQLLHARFDEFTRVPHYLNEDELFELLESLDPDILWKREYSGKLDLLFKELGKLAESLKGKPLIEGLIEAHVWSHREDHD